MIYIEDVFDQRPITMPEEVLWLAVIERAMMDYCKPTKELNIKDKNDLQWFFFTTEPKPFNLLFICDTIFDDAGAAKLIIKRINKLKEQAEPLCVSKIRFCDLND